MQCCGPRRKSNTRGDMLGKKWLLELVGFVVVLKRGVVAKFGLEIANALAKFMHGCLRMQKSKGVTIS